VNPRPGRARRNPSISAWGEFRGERNRLLDLIALTSQIDRMMQVESWRAGDFRNKMRIAMGEQDRWSSSWPLLAEKINVSRTSWLLPGLGESITATHTLPSLPSSFSIAATDGSQIFPDRHEISSCFLINIGYVLIHYGRDERPLLNSKPMLFYNEEDLYQDWGGRRVLANRETVGFKRGMLELTELADLSVAADDEGYTPLAAADGTLILWNLEGKPKDIRTAALTTLIDSWDRLRSRRVPIAGYISQPGSRELINALRVGLCPLEVSDCDHCPWQEGGDLHSVTEVEGIPCAAIDGLRDAALLRQLLEPGERSAVFASSSKILAEYGEHRVCFFYLHVGNEVARVEIPSWVAQDGEMLNQVHAILYDQARKGQGYPVVLAEAHERAVVRGADREAFYSFLRQHLVKHEIGAAISSKSLRKRVARV
jgi:hypothetical protein